MTPQNPPFWATPAEVAREDFASSYCGSVPCRALPGELETPAKEMGRIAATTQYTWLTMVKKERGPR